MSAPRRRTGETKQAMLDALAQRPMSQKELMAAVGITSVSTVQRALSEWMRDGIVQHGYVLMGGK